MKPLNYDTLAALPLFMGMDGAMLSSFYDEARRDYSAARRNDCKTGRRMPHANNSHGRQHNSYIFRPTRYMRN